MIAMLIAIDYDFTYTLDPVFWDAVITNGRRRGHEFVCVTGRERPPELDEKQPPVQVICSPEKYKGMTAAAAGLNVDVWIDDAPGTIEAGKIVEWEDRL